MRLELLFKTHVTRASTEQNSQRNLEKTGGGGRLILEHSLYIVKVFFNEPYIDIIGHGGRF